MSGILHSTVKQLAHKIKDTKGRPRFAFFLGAGASRDSKIITASEMIADFKKRLKDELCQDELDTDEKKDKWLREQDWYPKDSKDEYCKLFEKLEPKEYGRRGHIQRIIDGKEPSFGYAVLANLFASEYINTVITTNFDDLVNSACSIYTGIRPIIYAHGLLASEMRLIPKQPTILKLHGDYFYSTLKNTKKELKDQDPNMKTQVLRVLDEYGLVVVGYSGGDESVMETLSNISPKNDLYWCVQDDSLVDPSVEDLLKLVNPPVKELLEEKRGSIIHIKGFDQMMNEIREIVGFDVREMFGTIRDRQDYIIEKIQVFADNFAAVLLPKIAEALKEEHKLATESANKRIMNIECLDLHAQARAARDAWKIAEAETLYRQIIGINRQYKRAHNDLGIILEDMGRKDEAKEAYRKEIEINPEGTDAYSNLIKLLRSQDRDSDVLDSPDRDSEALKVAEEAFRNDAKSFELFISLVAIHKGLGNTSEADKYAADARKLLAPDDWYHIASLECVSGNKETAIANLKRAAEEDPEFDRPYAKKDPDFESIRNDPRFKEIVDDAGT